MFNHQPGNDSTNITIALGPQLGHDPNNNTEQQIRCAHPSSRFQGQSVWHQRRCLSGMMWIELTWPALASYLEKRIIQSQMSDMSHEKKRHSLALIFEVCVTNSIQFWL